MAMNLSDEVRVAASRAAVYAALCDPEILRQCIPGCEELTAVSEDELEAKVVLKIGPVKARFAGKVTLDRSGAPAAMKLSGQGQGGVAGFAKGSASVELEEEGDETILRYEANADVGGKIAQLGSRLIMGTARKLAAAFFTRFAAVMAGDAPADAADDEQEAGEEA